MTQETLKVTIEKGFKIDYYPVSEDLTLELPPLTVLTGINGSGKTNFLRQFEGVDNFVFNGQDIKFTNDMTTGLLNVDSEWAVYFDSRDLVPDQVSSDMLDPRYNLADEYKHFNQYRDFYKDIFNEFSEDINSSDLYIDDGNKKYTGDNINHLLEKHEIDDLDDKLYMNNVQLIFRYIKKEDIMSVTKEEYYEYSKNLNIPNIAIFQTPLNILSGEYLIKKRDFMRDETNRLLDDNTNPKEVFSKEILTQKFVELHGEPIWEKIHNELEESDVFDFNILPPKIDNPEDVVELDWNKNPIHMYYKNNPDVPIDLRNLSSGEKTLFAIFMGIYNILNGNTPSMIILDEPDAHLHPSMCKKFMEMIDEFFIKKGIRVIITTHHPTTVAMVPEESLFVMNKHPKEPRIEKTTKEDALYVLSEGFCTLDDTLIFENIVRGNDTVNILTEGKNIAYIEQAIKILAPEIKDKVHVIPELVDKTSKDQLKKYSVFVGFMSKILKEANFLIVYDCDVKNDTKHTNSLKRIEEYKSDNVRSFMFDENEDYHEAAESGIENIIPKSKMPKGDCYTTNDNGNHYITSKQKSNLAEWIITQTDKETFKNFQPLINEIKQIIETPQK